MPPQILKSNFKRLALKGLNVKEIAKELGYNITYFGTRMKQLLGVYPSVYIARMKKNAS